MAASGILTARIARTDNCWAQVHLTSPSDCEALLHSRRVGIAAAGSPDQTFLGYVDAGSDHTSLAFSPIRPLEVGMVVAAGLGDASVLYQITSARVEEAKVKGGAHLAVTARASQLGTFEAEDARLVRHRWVPPPGEPVRLFGSLPPDNLPDVPEERYMLGRVVGTSIPIYIDLQSALAGHLAILGMTRMGKTSFAHRLGNAIANQAFVVVLDQTGEWSTKRRLPSLADDHDLTSAGLFVYEPQGALHPADFALAFLRRVTDTAREQYERGAPTPRVIIIDEAHQFVPEPSGLGFQAPGRDSAVAFGARMMQLRKYGMALFLISQRTAVVAKSALSQCENIIAFRSVDQTGLEYLEAIAGRVVRDMLPQLRQGEALVLGPAISSDSPVVITMTHEEPRLPDAG